MYLPFLNLPKKALWIPEETIDTWDPDHMRLNISLNELKASITKSRPPSHQEPSPDYGVIPPATPGSL